MAVAPINKFITVAVPVSPNEQELYTSPVGTSAILLYAQVANVSAASTFPQVTFTHRRTSVATRTSGNVRDNRLVDTIEIPPNDALVIVDGRLVLERTALVEDSIRISGIQTGITTITDVRYNNVTGITTVTTLNSHGFRVGDKVTMAGIAFTCPSTAGVTSAIFPNPQVSFTIDKIEGTVGTSKTFTADGGIVNNLPHAYRPAFHRFVGLTTDSSTPVGVSTGTSSGPFGPTAIDYDPVLGYAEFEIGAHPLLGATRHTPTIIGGAGGDYNRSTGVLTIRIPNHNFQSHEKILIKPESMTFTCGSGSSKYPRPADPATGREADPAWNKWMTFTVVDTNNISVNVGSTGSGGNHTLTNIESNSIYRAVNFVTIAQDAFRFRCSQDEYKTVHAYPRSTDPAFNTAVAVGQTTYHHTFIGGDTAGIIDNSSTTYTAGSNTSYNPLTGDLVLDLQTNHSLSVGTAHTAGAGTLYNPAVGIMTVALTESTPVPALETGQLIKVANGGVTFSCNYGGGTHIYVGGTVNNAVTINGTQRNVTDASYNPTNGHLEVTIGSHSFTTSHTATIVQGSLTFTCDLDAHVSQHSYPRASDPAGGGATRNVVAVSGTTVTIDVGTTAGSGTAYPRSTDPKSGVWLSLTKINTNTFSVDVGIGTGATGNAHTFVSGVTGAIERSASTVNINANSLRFTCSRDFNKSVKTYPRSTDPAYQKSLPVTAKTTQTVTVNVGKANATSITVPVGVSTSGGRVGPLQMEFIGSILENSTV